MEGGFNFRGSLAMGYWELEDHRVVDLEEFFNPGSFVMERDGTFEAANSNGGLLNPSHSFGEYTFNSIEECNAVAKFVNESTRRVAFNTAMYAIEDVLLARFDCWVEAEPHLLERRRLSYGNSNLTGEAGGFTSVV